MTRSLAPDAVDAPLRAGDVVAEHYEIRQRLGGGAMGTVFEAHDRLLNRRVAIKVANTGADPTRLRREGQALAAIRHPGVVGVHAIAQHAGDADHDGPRDLLILERIFGVSLEATLEQRRRRGEAMPLPEVIDRLIAIADALAAVHAAGLAHRDVTPANVMLTPSGRVVLTDLGLMMPLADGPLNDPADALAGSLPYMAPEALRGAVAAGRAPLLDVYGLGVVAFRMLTGILPYGGDDATSLLAAMRRGVPRASSRRRGLDSALDDFVHAAMALDPTERPASAEAIVWQLRRMRAKVEQRDAPREPLSVLVASSDARAADALSLFVRAAAGDATITIASSGDDALRAIRGRMPNVLLLDLALPDTNGLEVVMYVRGMHAGLSCVIVADAAQASAGDRQLLTQLGVHLVAPEERGPAAARFVENLRAGSAV